MARRWTRYDANHLSPEALPDPFHFDPLHITKVDVRVGKRIRLRRTLLGVVPVELWNHKNKVYLELPRLSNCLNLRYEDILDDPILFLQKVSDFLPRKDQDFTVPQDAVKEDDVSKKDFNYYRDYYLNEKWRSKLNATHISQINTYLDKDLVQHFAYDVLDAGTGPAEKTLICRERNNHLGATGVAGPAPTCSSKRAAGCIGQVGEGSKVER